ncbi:hypothetical protein [Pseudonocardia sp. T1-2H]|uniref:hypothetical protein n=1 Tax=Pseudonocardia sp. T1-2H TaxID=3128899 RepID=UPI003100FEA9
MTTSAQKVAIVTGASRGIGAGVVEGYRKQVAAVVNAIHHSAGVTKSRSSCSTARTTRSTARRDPLGGPTDRNQHVR